MIKVRFAPSPTGYLHIGGARTALFNWVYARSQNAKFVLRIEDTDLQRSGKEYVKEILDSMEWLGLKWDEIYYQSQRFDIYLKYAEKLLDTGKAYREGSAVILKIPQQEVKIFDIIRGEIVFDTANIKDQVLIKSDGSPTYSFACVVDDALMEISHVIRGEDHISNTPKQIMIYQALDLKVPKFAHLPLIMGEDGERLSKRTGAVAVSDYCNKGFIPEALVNYLLLLGWAPGGNQEKIDLVSAVKKFSLKKVNKAAAIFSLEKLTWLNGQYVKEMPTEEITKRLIPLLKEKGYINDDFDGVWLQSIVKLFQSRVPTLIDFLERASFFFVDKIHIDQEQKDKLLLPEKKEEFDLLIERFQGLETFDAMSTEKAFRAFVEEHNIKSSDLVHPVRVALTGSTVGPGLFETIALLGKMKTIERLSKAFD